MVELQAAAIDVATVGPKIALVGYRPWEDYYVEDPSCECKCAHLKPSSEIIIYRDGRIADDENYYLWDTWAAYNECIADCQNLGNPTPGRDWYSREI